MRGGVMHQELCYNKERCRTSQKSRVHPFPKSSEGQSDLFKQIRIVLRKFEINMGFFDDNSKTINK